MIVVYGIRLSNKDWLDQPAHLAAGAGSVLIGSLLSGNSIWVMALVSILSFGYACLREYKQHPDTGNFIDLDSMIWLVGIVAAFWLCSF